MTHVSQIITLYSSDLHSVSYQLYLKTEKKNLILSQRGRKGGREGGREEGSQTLPENRKGNTSQLTLYGPDAKTKVTARKL